MLARVMARVRDLISRRSVAREIDEELRFHVDREVEANLSRGLSPAEARRRALADLGGLTQTAETVRALRAIGLRRFWTDLRDAVRGLRIGRGTTVLAFTMLTLTMAAGTVCFSIVDGVALRPLPFGRPERLIGISIPSSTPGGVMPASPQDYFEWLEGAQTLESVGAARLTPSLELELDGVRETHVTSSITANLLDVLGVRPAIGRSFESVHERPGGPAAVILSHGLWVRRFGADPDVVGRQIAFGQQTKEILGVLPRAVWYPMTTGPQPDLYIPYVVTASERSNARGVSMFVVGRLRPGVSLDQARADLQRMSSAVVLTLHDQVVGPAKTWLLLVLAAVGLVLLVACANVATLLLARATTRARELATREALGAARGRLVTGLLLEGMLLAFTSSLAAFALSLWGVKTATSYLPPGLSRVSTISVDARVFLVSIGVAVLCGLLFSSAPAWLVRRDNPLQYLKAGSGAIIGDRRRYRALSAFLVADLAFVCVLLTATALVVTSYVLITTADLGFDRQNVMRLSYRRSIAGVGADDRPAAARTLREEVLQRARSVAGVTAAAVITNSTAPLSGGGVRYSITIPGVGETTRDDMLDTRMVTPDYFQVMDMRLIRGRTFSPTDEAGAPLVMLINDVAARQFFPGRDPVGQVVEFRGPTTIVGVLRGVRARGPETEVRPEMYTPADQEDPHYLREPITSGTLVVRLNRQAPSLAAAVREAIRPALGGSEPGPPEFMDDDFRRLTAGRRFNAAVMVAFGLIAAAIGAIGVYGAMAFDVAQQIRVIGLRMALGASRSDVRRVVIWNALKRVTLGTCIGLAGAWVVSSALESFVFGIRPTAPAVYLAVGSFLAFIGLAASLGPALRAARLDPLSALRHD